MDGPTEHPGTLAISHSPMNSEDLDWCARHATTLPGENAWPVPWWADQNDYPVIHATQVAEYMQLVDDCVRSSPTYRDEFDAFRKQNYRVLQQHQLTQCLMTWEDTILPLLDVDEWTLSQGMVFMHFVRFRLCAVARPNEGYVQQPLLPVDQRNRAIRTLCQRLPFCGDCSTRGWHRCITQLWQHALLRDWHHCPDIMAELVAYSLRFNRVQIEQMVQAGERKRTAAIRTLSDRLKASRVSLTWSQTVYQWARAVMDWSPVTAIAIVARQLTLNQLEDHAAAAIDWLELGALLRAACTPRTYHTATTTTVPHTFGHRSSVHESLDDTAWRVFIGAMHGAAELHSNHCTTTRLAQVLLCFARVPLMQQTADAAPTSTEATYGEALRAIKQRFNGSNSTFQTAATRVLSGPPQLQANVEQWRQLLNTVSHQKLDVLPLHAVADVYALHSVDVLDAPFHVRDMPAALQFVAHAPAKPVRGVTVDHMARQPFINDSVRRTMMIRSVGRHYAPVPSSSSLVLAQ